MKHKQILAPSPLVFSDVLACSIHDIKNSLELLSCSFDTLIDETPEIQRNKDQLACLQYEIKRINSTICYLLTIYKHAQDEYVLDSEYQSVYEYIHQLAGAFSEFTSVKGVEIDIDCDNDLFWAFDDDLVSLVLEEMVNNSLRYTQDRLRLSARTDGEYLLISVEDNGSGYPQPLLAEDFFDKVPKCSLSNRTGLGIFFAGTIAKSHIRGERRGFIQIGNDSALGGGRFTLALP